MSFVGSIFNIRVYLTQGEKRKYLLFLTLQIFLGILDLLAIVLIGVVSLLAIKGSIDFQSNFLPLGQLLTLDNLQLFAAASLMIFLSKTVLSFILSRIILNFAKSVQLRILSQQVEKIGKIRFNDSYNLISRHLAQNLTEGINAFSIGIVGYSLLAASEMFLVGIIFIPLFLFAPILTIFIVTIFTIAFFFIHRITSRWSIKSGGQRIKSFEEIRNTVGDTFRIAKILRVTDRYADFTNKIVLSGESSAKANSDVYLIQLIPKYVLEGTIIIGAMFLGAFFTFQNDLGKSIGVISIFLAASMRVLPSLLRLQGAILIIKKSFGEASVFLNTMTILQQAKNLTKQNLPTLSNENIVELTRMSFSYNEFNKPIFKDFTSFIPKNKVTVIEGPSGSGKTTLLDLILGLLEVNSGEIKSSLKSFAVGYMTQDSEIVSGTIAENIKLGKDNSSNGGLSLEECLKMVGLNDWINTLPKGLETFISSDLNHMSGGQRQRLGLARAIYASDELLVIDEPTSSLDDDSEDLIFDSLKQLRGVRTVIIVAHTKKPRLFADHVITITQD